MNKHISNFIMGIVVGIGFGLAAGAIYYFLYEKMISDFRNGDPEEIKKISIVSHEEQIRSGVSVFLGTIRNNGETVVDAINVQVDLISSEGKFVEQCDAYVKGKLMPGESRNFKVKCAGCNDQVTVPHEKYEIKVIKAY